MVYDWESSLAKGTPSSKGLLGSATLALQDLKERARKEGRAGLSSTFKRGIE